MDDWQKCSLWSIAIANCQGHGISCEEVSKVKDKVLPEEEYVIKINSHYYSGKAFYDAIRYLRDKWWQFKSGFDEPTPTDKLILQIALKQYSGTGTATTWPKDIMDFIYSLSKCCECCKDTEKHPK